MSTVVKSDDDEKGSNYMELLIKCSHTQNVTNALNNCQQLLAYFKQIENKQVLTSLLNPKLQHKLPIAPYTSPAPLNVIIRSFKAARWENKSLDVLWLNIITEMIKLGSMIEMERPYPIQQHTTELKEVLSIDEKYDMQLFKLLFVYMDPVKLPAMINHDEYRQYYLNLANTEHFDYSWRPNNYSYAPSLELCSLGLQNCCRINDGEWMPEPKPFMFILWILTKQLKHELIETLCVIGDDLCAVDSIWNVVSTYIIDHAVIDRFIMDTEFMETFIVEAFKEFILHSAVSIFDQQKNLNDVVFVMQQFMNNDVMINYLNKQKSVTLLKWLVWITRKYDADNVAILFFEFVKFDDKKMFDKIIRILMKYCLDKDEFELISKLLMVYDGDQISNMRWNDCNILSYTISKYVVSKCQQTAFALLKSIIMKHDINCNQYDGFDEYPLLKACENQLIHVIELLLNEGNANIDIVAWKSGMRAIHFALRYGNIKMIKLLLTYKPQIDVWTKENENIFTIICSSEVNKNKMECAKLLVQYAKQNDIKLSFILDKTIPMSSILDKGFLSTLELIELNLPELKQLLQKQDLY